jgi:hypothetical protein
MDLPGAAPLGSVQFRISASEQCSGQPVIIFVVTPEHPYTWQAAVQESPGLKLRIATYDQLFRMTKAPRATYVFSDLDRLPMWRVRHAARVYRQLRDGGVRVLNDPARLPSRYGLLRKLYRHGINHFDTYRVEEGIVPARWPVFLRAEGEHEAPLTDLMHSWDEAQHAIESAVAAGAPVSSLLLIEYAAEPVRPGLFRKLSVFRIGDAYFGATCVHDDKWLVKYGTVGIAPAELYEDELRIVRDNPFGAALKPAFELAAIEYGRADFGLVGGKVQIYEINSNPHIAFPTEHPSVSRLESIRILKQNFYEALAKIDTPAYTMRRHGRLTGDRGRHVVMAGYPRLSFLRAAKSLMARLRRP